MTEGKVGEGTLGAAVRCVGGWYNHYQYAIAAGAAALICRERRDWGDVVSLIEVLVLGLDDRGKETSTCCASAREALEGMAKALQADAPEQSALLGLARQEHRKVQACVLSCERSGMPWQVRHTC